MIFHEIYGCYYLCMEKIINHALNHTLTQDKILEIINQYAFEDSHIEIMSHLKNQDWPLITQDYHTPLHHPSTRPLTLLEKRWLKSLSLDPRIQLFSKSFDNLDDIEPLFTNDDYLIYDQYLDGDCFDDELYIKNFQTILYALENQFILKVTYQNKQLICHPTKLEYSLKDNKFRLKTSHDHFHKTLNLSKITNCELTQQTAFQDNKLYQNKQSVILELYDERSALERAMMQFADLQKKAEQINDKTYRIELFYQKEDETELLIRILSFGPLLKVIEPQRFVQLIQERLKLQLSCGLR
ncbi:WYL domain-containing protein [Longibaculum muris]|uniref:WYL domain-containing protein n=1 Tax=Longibaculum muris TaxID=1796628 RepID=UPI0022E3675E|nr:WYL domain-containing protein [Longibaculum muris]